MRKLFLLLVLLLLPTLTSSAQSPNVDDSYNAFSLIHDGQQRLAHIYEPETEIQGAMIALHTLFSSARAMEGMSGLNTIADERGWVMVYPEALQAYWDDGRTDVDLPPDNGAVDDAGYLATLADTLRETYDITDVYLTGYAQGGTMALRTVCDYPDSFDGVAIVSALMWDYQVEGCSEQTGMDMLFIKGTDDHIYWDTTRTIGQQNQWSILGVLDTYRFWAQQFNCSAPIRSDIEGSSIGIANCENDYRVAFLPIFGTGNAWVRSGDASLNNVGLEATDIIAAFLDGDEDWAALTVQTELMSSEPRSYITYVPPTYDPTTPTPVVISLHGRGVNNISQALSSDWNAVAEEHGFIVIYPQAYDRYYRVPEYANTSWNYERDNPFYAAPSHDDDLFLDQMIDEVTSLYNVDDNRLYVNGLSNGGYMTHRLACTRSDRYAAFATMAANAPFGVSIFCDDQSIQSPILIYHGTSDTISPWNGLEMPISETQNSFVLAPITETVNFWLFHNECGDAFTETDLANTDETSNVVHVSYIDCPDDAAVELYAVINGGHVWHGIRDFDNEFLGEVNMDVNASEVIWDFYQQFTLEGRVDTDIVRPEPDRTGNGFPDIESTFNIQPPQ